MLGLGFIRFRVPWQWDEDGGHRIGANGHPFPLSRHRYGTAGKPDLGFCRAAMVNPLQASRLWVWADLETRQHPTPTNH